jgi:protein phosphatase
MPEFALTTAGGCSETGSVRHGNEDCFAVNQALGLFVVADGMGGHSAGEVASRLAVDTIVNFVAQSHDNTEFSWPYGIVPTLSYDGNRLRTAVHLANRRVYRSAESHDDYLGMGTTVVVALASPGRLVVAHVGDSRAYRLRAGQLEQLTQDDSWVATMLASDVAADPGAFVDHPMRHVLTNALGARDETVVHLQEVETRSGDAFLLCTDGVHGALDTAGLAGLLAHSQEPATSAAEIVAAALAAGSRDNVTAVVMAFHDSGNAP